MTNATQPPQHCEAADALAAIVADIADALDDNAREHGDVDCLRYAADLCSSLISQANELRDAIVTTERAVQA